MSNYVHIDKTIKKVDFDIEKKPIGSTQWDFLNCISGAKKALKDKMAEGADTIFVFLSLDCREKCLGCKLQYCKQLARNYNYQDFMSFLDYFKKIKTSYIIFDGNSIDHKDFWKILRRSNELGFQVSVNAERTISLMELDKLRKYGIQKIQMKLYGLVDEHKKFQDNYSDIIKNLELFKKEKVYSSIIFSIREDNKQNIKKYIKFCEKYNVGQFSFMRLPSCPFHPTKNWPFLNRRSFLELSKEIIRHRESSEVHITSNEAIWKGCGAAAVSCCLLPDNLVTPCAYIAEYHKLKKVSDFNKLWKSKLFSNLRESRNLKGKCGKCEYNFFCKGCRAVAGLIKKDIYASDPGCWLSSGNKNEK